VVLERILGRDITVSPLQPPLDNLSGAPEPSGWQAVRAFCRKNCERLAASVHDLIVIHVDADVRHKVAKELVQPAEEGDDAGEDLAALCAHVRSWLGAAPPPGTVIVLPKEQSEAWLLAAHTQIKDVEAVAQPKDILVEKRLLPVEERERTTAVYTRLAGPLERVLTDPKRLKAVGELARFVGKLQQGKRAVLQAKKAKGS
jgi:hypothetical protein